MHKTWKDKLVLCFIKWMMREHYSIFINNELAFGCMEPVDDGTIKVKSEPFREVHFTV